MSVEGYSLQGTTNVALARLELYHHLNFSLKRQLLSRTTSLKPPTGSSLKPLPTVLLPALPVPFALLLHCTARGPRALFLTPRRWEVIDLAWTSQRVALQLQLHAVASPSPPLPDVSRARRAFLRCVVLLRCRLCARAAITLFN